MRFAKQHDKVGEPESTSSIPFRSLDRWNWKRSTPLYPARALHFGGTMGPRKL